MQGFWKCLYPKNLHLELGSVSWHIYTYTCTQSVVFYGYYPAFSDIWFGHMAGILVCKWLSVCCQKKWLMLCDAALNIYLYTIYFVQMSEISVCWCFRMWFSREDWCVLGVGGIINFVVWNFKVSLQSHDKKQGWVVNLFYAEGDNLWF